MAFRLKPWRDVYVFSRKQRSLVSHPNQYLGNREKARNSMTGEFFSNQSPAGGPDYPPSSPRTHFLDEMAEAAKDNAPAGKLGREQQMREIAESIGGVLGNAVRHARGISSRARGGLQLVQGHVDRTLHRPHEVPEAATPLPEGGAGAANWQETVRQRLFEARQRVEEITTEYPLQIILSLAAAAFAIGFAVRIGRSTRG
jgi:hypothetical protein